MLSLSDLRNRPGDDRIFELQRVQFYLLLIYLEGEGVHQIDFEDYAVSRGTVILLRPDRVHLFASNPGVNGRLVCFTEEFVVSFLSKNEVARTLQLFNEVIGDFRVPFEGVDQDDLFRKLDLIDREFEKGRDDYSEGIFRNLVQVLLSTISRHRDSMRDASPRSNRLGPFLDFQSQVESRCFETRRVQDYADALGTTSKQLNQIAKAALGISAKTFIDRVTVLQLKRMLINSELSVKEIAYEAGFDEPSNMFRYFRKQTDISPGEFRKTHGR